METNPKPASHLSPMQGAAERRSKLRIYEPFPAIVRGIDARGEAFEIETVLDNLGANGLYLRLAKIVDPGTKLLITVHLSTDRTAVAPCVEIHGMVLRTEFKSANEYGVGVVFTRHSFI